METLESSLERNGIEVRGGEFEPPNVVGQAGQSGIAVGAIAPDRNHADACWFWLVADNLRLAAENAVAGGEATGMTGVGTKGPGAGGLVALVAFALAAAGCGYHVAGHADVMPKTMKTIAMPPLHNTTPQPKLATLLTADITREFISRTHYTIVSDPAQADAVLTGTVTNYATSPPSSTLFPAAPPARN